MSSKTMHTPAELEPNLTPRKVNADNYEWTVLQFRDRQAGISLVYDPVVERYTYNVYCIEVTLLTELFTCEFEFLDDALSTLHEEFGQWQTRDLSDAKGCGSCAAKKH